MVVHRSAFLFIYPAILAHGVFLAIVAQLTVMSFVISAIISPRGVSEGRGGGGRSAWAFVAFVATWITRGEI